MSAAALLAAWALAAQVAAAPAAPGAAGPGRLTGAAAPVRVLEHSLDPPRPEAGARADERVVVWAPEGVHLRIDDAGPAGEGVERQGSWWVARSPVAGGVRWTFTAPLTAWEAGARRGPELALVHRRGSASSADTLRISGVSVALTSPLDGESPANLAPAPPAGPWEGPGPRWPLALGLTAAGAAGLLGAARRRRGSGGPEPERGAALPAPGAGVPTPEVALRLAARDPAGAAVALAEAVRGHPRAVLAGVTPAHATPDVAARLPLDGVREALALGDAVKYGGRAPTSEEVLTAGRRVARALGEGGRGGG